MYVNCHIFFIPLIFHEKHERMKVSIANYLINLSQQYQNSVQYKNSQNKTKKKNPERQENEINDVNDNKLDSE